jgi:CDP-paratose synthetase
MRILITGAGGFLGSALALHVRQAGHTVGLLIRTHSDLSRLNGCEKEFETGRFERDDELVSFVASFSPEVIVHTACAYGRKGESFVQLLDANVRFGLLLLQAAGNLPHPVAFFQAGTVLPPEVSPYALGKHQLAQWGQMISSLPDSPVHFLHVRLQHLYGPDRDPSKFPVQVLLACMKNLPELPLTSGEQLRDFIYIEDAVAAFVVLMENWTKLEKTCEVEMGSGRAVSVRTFVETIHRLTGSTTALRFGALPYRPNEAMFCESDNTLLENLGWRPRYDLESWLEKTMAFIQSNLLTV